jgi:hypothetical protein
VAEFDVTEHDLDAEQESSQRQPQRLPVHQTALRLITLWHWLTTTPMSYGDIQKRFLQEQNYQLSDHSLRVYFFTLRTFGCVIPRHRNSDQVYVYHISEHEYLETVFQNVLTVEYMDRLAELGSISQDIEAQHNWLTFLNQLARWSKLDWQITLLKQGWQDLIKSTIEEQGLLQVVYAGSEAKGVICLPLGTFIHRYRLNLRVIRHDKPGTSSFRVDKIHSITPVSPSAHQALFQSLRNTLRFQPVIEVHFHVPPNYPLPMLADVNNIYPLPDNRGLAVYLETRDTFLLEQQLLSCGLPFTVVSPLSVKQHIEGLLTMLRHHHNG